MTRRGEELPGFINLAIIGTSLFTAPVDSTSENGGPGYYRQALFLFHRPCGFDPGKRISAPISIRTSPFNGSCGFLWRRSTWGLKSTHPFRSPASPLSKYLSRQSATPNSRAVHALSADDDVIGYDAGDTSPSLILRQVHITL